MAHVVLDSNGNIIGAFANPQPGIAGYAEIPDDDPRVAAWQAGQAQAAAPAFLARDLIAQLTPDDYTAIQSAVAGSAALGLLWSALLAQGSAPISTASDRFKVGWTALSKTLGATRAAAIAKALGIA
jgi:hypothetical protein